MIIALASTLLGLGITIFSVSLFMAIAGLFIAMSGVQWAFSLSFMFISETVAESHREQFLVVVQFFYGLGTLGNTGLFYWLADWKPIFIYFYVIPTALLLVGVVFFVVDTPLCLIKKYNEEKVMEKLLWIAKVNGIDNPQISTA